MRYIDYCLKHKIPTFPLRLWIHPTWIGGMEKNGIKVDILSDGSQKQKKQICGDKFKNKADLINMYGEELGEWLLARPKGTKVLPSGVIKITSKYTEFDLPDEMLRKYMRARWKEYQNGNRFGYTHFAVDTKCIGVLDIDCVMDEDDPMYKLKDKLPFKCSNTKGFGFHGIFNRKAIPTSVGRRSHDLDKSYGVQASGQAGVEFLDGIWEWSGIDDEIEFPQDCEEGSEPPINKYLEKILLKLNGIHQAIQQSNNIMNYGGETKTSREPTTPAPVIPMATASIASVVGHEVGISSYPLEIIQENLAQYGVENMATYTKWAGVCISFGSSNCEEVYQLLVASCKRIGANYGGDAAIREKWDLYNPDQHAIPDPVTGKSYKGTFDTFWCVKKEQQFDWKGFMLDDDMFIQKKFVKDHKHNFIFNACYDEHNLCYFDEKTTLWKHNRKKGVAKKVIKKILMNETRQYWEDEMEKSIESMADPEADDEGVVPPNKFKELCIKFKNKTLKKFYSTGGWASGTITNIINLLECELEEEHIQFNLMEITKDYFQFKNKAYDLRNGLLIDRTREMYVSAGGVLDYDFPEYRQMCELDNEMDIIDKMMTTILPNPAIRRLFCLWRGYNLTGHTNAQMFFVFLGEGAENGKSTLCEIFQVSFPVYVNPIDNDAIDDKAKNDKSLSSCLDKPYRILFIEEAEKIGKKIKKCVNFETCRIKPLYCEETTLMINFGLELLTNGGIDANTDNGVLRRGRTLMFESKFTCNPEEVDEEQHIYLADQTLVPRFKDDIKMKLALFLYFAKFSKEYYDMGINDFKGEFEICKVAFKAEQASDDPWESFINDRFEKTEDEGDVIWKKDMMRYVIEEFGDNEYTAQKTNGDWDFKSGVFSRVICNNFRKRRYKYESGLRGRDVNGNLQKGMFHNIKYVPFTGQESDGEEEYN